MNILVFCTYPISEPRHGGQLRVKNIVETYRSLGHAVELVGVLGSEQYPWEDGFLPFPDKDALKSVLNNNFLMEDYVIGQLMANDNFYYNKLSNLIKIKPDLIHVEQPWLYNFVSRYLKEKKIKTKILYGSQNTEWKLKKTIASTYLEKSTASQYSDLVKEIELDAINGADTIACVSEEDVLWVKSQVKKNIILAPNGVTDWNTSDAGQTEASAITLNYQYALYCASAHPPNMTGFFDIFGNGFGSLKPDEKLVIAGGAGWAIAGDIRVHQSPKLAEKVINAGFVSQPCLEGLLDNAQCIVLPLTQGGGTNLKTAEALWSKKHIVATSIAMRGFEEFKDSPGVHVADDPSDFKRKLRFVMAEPKLNLSINEINKRRKVIWSSCLEPLVQHIKNIQK
jgi:hypothetical protein